MKKNYLFLTIITFVFTSNLTLSQITETENFDNCSSCTQEFDLSSEATPSGFWNGSDDDSSGRGWQIHSGGTPSGGTGPSGAYNGNYYAYAETSGSSNKIFILESDTFSSSSTNMSFYYHMYGATIGRLYVDESTDGGDNWNNLLFLMDEDQEADDEAWVQVTSGSGQFTAISSNANKIRIRYISGSSFTGDAAIDQIVVTYTPGPTISVGSAITGLEYESGSGPSTSQSTTVSGSNLEADITLTAPTNFEISTDDSSFADSVTLSHSSGTVNSTTIYARLKSGLSVNSYSGNITASSTNAPSGTISLSGDVVLPAIVSHDFESSDDGWTSGGSVGSTSWSRTNSLGEFETGNSGYAWTITPHHDYNNSSGAHITSSAIDMSAYEDMTLNLDIRYNTETGYDGMNMYYSTDNSNWTILGSNGAANSSNWYNNSGVYGINLQYAEITSDPHGWSGDNSSWSTASIPIPDSLEGQSSVYFRVYFGSDSSVNYDGAAFDNFIIRGTASGPFISVGSAAITGLNYATGSGPSTSQSTTVSGTSLEADITLTAPTNFEISTDDSSFTDSVTLSHSGGTVNSTTIYARLKSGLSTGSYSGNITASSTNATSQTISLSGSSGATNLYVSTSGNNSNNGLTSEAPFATVTYALSQAVNGLGVTINLAAGTYTEDDIQITKSNITVDGAGATTIFDGDYTERLFTIVADNVTISDMLIMEYGHPSGSTNTQGGGAIRIGGVADGSTTEYETSYSGININYVTFQDNYVNATSGDGGAIELVKVTDASNATIAVDITGCVFKGNKAGTSSSSYSDGHNGGAIKLDHGSDVTITNSLFYENRCEGQGAGIANYNYGEVDIINCTFADNISQSYDGAVFGQAGAVVVIRNSIIYNTTSNGSSLSYDLRAGSGVEDFTWSNTIYRSEYVDEACSNCLTSDPQFKDSANDDYDLADNSPAIDYGSSTYAPASDINQLSRAQGQADDVGAYESPNTWDGSTSTDWGTAANWRDDIVPVTDRSPIIADVTNQPVISSDDGSSGDVTLEDITINSGAELTINKEASLTLTDDFTNNSGSVYLESDSNEFASIIVQGDASGNITYKRYVNAVTANGWDLIGSPVDGLDINTFVSDNSGVLATNGVQVAIGTYNNSNDDWSNYTTDGSGAGNISAVGNFDIGKGYQMGTVDGGSNILQFTGTIATADQLQAVINNHGNGDGRRWNLVANPFPSYLMLNDDAHGSNNFLTVNNSVIDGSYLAAYGYDADGSGFTAYGQDFNSNTAKYVAPGQAFMVAASSSSSANLSVTEAMLTTTGSDDFISGDNMENTEIYLKLYNGDQMIETTHIKFQENMTLGLDPGYDLGNYFQGAALTTRLVENDEGNNFEHQQLPISAMENAVIPLVINQSAGQEFRINLHTATIPDPNVYLEDVEEGTFTNLYEGDFVYTPTSDLSGVGRFFIHMTADTMSNEEVSTTMLNAYKEIDASYITIEGLATQTNETKVSLYNILGREVLSTTLNNNMGTQTISTVGLSAGIYVIELESGTDRLTKKLLIQ